MTEEEWLATTDPIPMLMFLRQRTSQRKLRLYFCGGARSLAHQFFRPESLAAVEVAEKFAEGEASIDDLDQAGWEAELPTFGEEFRTEGVAYDSSTKTEVIPRLIEMGVLPPTTVAGMEWQVEDTVRVRLLAAASLAEFCATEPLSESDWGLKYLPRVDWPGRWLTDCVFGNPFHSAVLEPTWLDETVNKLAAAAYEERFLPSGVLDTERLAILSDALEDAGCTDADVFAHLRSPGPHVRGCWALDLLLEKE